MNHGTEGWQLTATTGYVESLITKKLMLLTEAINMKDQQNLEMINQNMINMYIQHNRLLDELRESIDRTRIMLFIIIGTMCFFMILTGMISTMS